MNERSRRKGKGIVEGLLEGKREKRMERKIKRMELKGELKVSRIGKSEYVRIEGIGEIIKMKEKSKGIRVRIIEREEKKRIRIERVW